MEMIIAVPQQNYVTLIAEEAVSEFSKNLNDKIYLLIWCNRKQYFTFLIDDTKE